MNPAVFLDKDGTVLDDVPFNVAPERMRFAPGAEDGLRLLHEAGFRLFVVSNQTGVALGYFEERALGPMAARLEAMFAEVGVPLGGFYYCPHLPAAPESAGTPADSGAGTTPGARITPGLAPGACDCRKPAPGMLLRAAREHGVDLDHSWMVGDILHDVEAGRRAGCRTVLVDNGNETEWLPGEARHPDFVAHDLSHAARLILAERARAGVSIAHAAPWARAAHVLCVRLDQMGDLLMTTPAIRALKAAHPGRRVTLLTSPGAAEAARHIPEVDAVISHAASWMKAAPASAEAELALVEELRARQFDAAVIFTVFSQSPLPAAQLCRLAGIPLRLAHCRENPYGLLSDWLPETEPQTGVRHEVQRQLDLVAAVGARAGPVGLSFQVPGVARTRVAELLARLGADRDRLVVVHPGASAPSRRYPPEHYAAAARGLVEELGADVVFSGGPGEVPLVEQIRRGMGAASFSLAGQLNLAELAALVELSRLLVSNNTGPAHLAAAVQTPVVDLYALTNPQHTPWGVASRVLSYDVACRNCFKSVCPQAHHACLRLVKPAAVVTAARELLGGPLPRRCCGRASAGACGCAGDVSGPARVWG